MRRLRFRSVLLVLALGTVLLIPAGALGANAVITDCNAHGTLTRHYTVAQLRTALNTMPPTVKEYTDCSDVINRALLAQVGSPGGGGSSGQSSGGSFLPVWLIVLLLVLVLGGGAYAVAATRARRSARGPEPPPAT